MATAAKREAGRAGEDLAVARRVIETEAAGLAALAAALDDSFVGAVDTLGAVTGRVIVSGMGKSGHVARKVAATFASTGTPAQFVHPAEASHGDLGMITREDAVLALSNSGETAEFADLVAYVKLCRIPLVAITGRRGSALDKAADVSLIIPDSAEACPLDLAPTTSTAVMLALGDALAVALLERIGFGPEDFQMRHPGGELGRRFIKVADVMHAGAAMPLIRGETAMADALIEMSAKSFGCVGVVAGDGRLAGIITDGDLRRHMHAGLLAERAAAVMTPRPLSLPADALAAQALGIMNERKITSIFVVDAGGVPLGIVHIHDCLRAGVA